MEPPLARLDVMALFRGKKPADAYAARDVALVEWAKSDGYKALLDLYEREMRGVFLAWLIEKDPAKLEAHRNLGRAIHTLIRRVDERAATIQAAETMKDLVKRQVGEMAVDRQELAELDRAMTERAFHNIPQNPTSRPAFQPAY